MLQYRNMIRIIAFLIYICTACLLPVYSFAQVPIGVSGDSIEEEVSTVRARVINIVASEDAEVLYGNNRTITIQTVEAELLEGVFKGDTFLINQDYLGLEKGDVFLVEQYIQDGVPEYRLVDFDRGFGLRFIFLVFVILILVFAQWQGLRSLVSLAGSLLVILYVLVPLLAGGAPPIATSVLLATGILAIAIFFTHGFNKRSLIAFAGTTLTVLITGILAAWVVDMTHLTGFSSDEATFLDFNTEGQLDFAGLLLAGIIIGVLGVLDDIAITQVAVVRELYSLNPDLSRKEVFTRALRVGKEHVSALVNTLVLAYVGVSLPLLLYVSTLGVSDVSLVVNSEIFATEIVRTVLGSIGLILAVPLSTFAAAIFLEKTRGIPLSEKEKHEGCAHGHSH